MGGSGGGASGAVTFPSYMTAFHGALLDNASTDLPSHSFIDTFNDSYDNSPFIAAVAYNPDAELSAAVLGVTAFSTAIASLDHLTNFNAAVTTARAAFPQGTTPLQSTTLYTTTLDSLTVTDEDIAEDVSAMNDILTNELEENDLVKFKAGMLNINAVHSSAFIIGEALLRAAKDRTLAKYATDLQLKVASEVREINARHQLSFRELTARLQTSFAEIDARLKTSKTDIDAKFYIHREELVKNATSIMIEELLKKTEFTYQHAHINSEVRRLSITAKKEEKEEQLSITESDAKWNLELFRYAGIILAAPSGGVAQGNEKKSRAVSAIGGAISGAAMGAMAMPAAPYAGAAVGAVAGVGLALLS